MSYSLGINTESFGAPPLIGLEPLSDLEPLSSQLSGNRNLDNLFRPCLLGPF